MTAQAFDLGSLEMKDTFFLQLRHPVTDEPLTVKAADGSDSEVGITLYGPASRQYRNAIQGVQSRALRRQAKKATATPQEMQEEAVNLLVAVSAGSKNLSFDGISPQSADEFRQLYNKASLMWIKDQVDEALGNTGNFLTQ